MCVFVTLHPQKIFLISQIYCYILEGDHAQNAWALCIPDIGNI